MAETQKFMLYVDGLGNPLVFLLSSVNDHNSKYAVPLFIQIDIKGSNILGDKAYGAKAIREYIDSQDAVYTIPPQSNVSDPWPIDWHTYKERHLVECFFQKLKWFRRVFTRYDKLDASFLAFVHIAAIAILLKKRQAKLELPTKWIRTRSITSKTNQNMENGSVDLIGFASYGIDGITFMRLNGV